MNFAAKNLNTILHQLVCILLASHTHFLKRLKGNKEAAGYWPDAGTGFSPQNEGFFQLYNDAFIYKTIYNRRTL